MTTEYFVRRLANFFLVVFVAASVNFWVPRLAPGDPVGAMLQRFQTRGQAIEHSAQIIETYRERFGLDESLVSQYGSFLESTFTFNFGYSLSYFPVPVADIIARSIPWTLGLLVASTMIAFFLAVLIGALFVWRGTPRAARAFSWLLVGVSAVPYYLIALILLYLLAFAVPLFPTGGVAGIGEITRGLSFGGMMETVYHSILPALSIVLASLGGTALSMRGMMVTVLGEDYLFYAEARGLRERRVFLRYAVRNAILPQVTQFAISLGNIVSGAVLVEVIFSYPGMGMVLVEAIRGTDYTLIQGITFILVLSVAGAVFLVDLINPYLDPRITYRAK